MIADRYKIQLPSDRDRFRHSVPLETNGPLRRIIRNLNRWTCRLGGRRDQSMHGPCPVADSTSTDFTARGHQPTTQHDQARARHVLGRGCVRVCSMHTLPPRTFGLVNRPIHSPSPWSRKQPFDFDEKEEEDKRWLPLSSTWMDSRETLVQKFHHVCPCQLTLDDSVPIVLCDMISFTFDNSVIPATLRPRSAPVTQLATFTSWWSGLILPANKPSILRA